MTVFYNYIIIRTFFKLNTELEYIQYNNSNNNNIYLLQLGCHPVAVVILHVYKT